MPAPHKAVSKSAPGGGGRCERTCEAPGTPAGPSTLCTEAGVAGTRSAAYVHPRVLVKHSSAGVLLSRDAHGHEELPRVTCVCKGRSPQTITPEISAGQA
jgi:hypothetical protein